jgi:threonyl-tRNA synthetase
VRFSRHDPKHFEKYLGTKEIWEKAENSLKKLIEKRGVKDYIDGAGEAAMYGPKLDFITTDSLGRTLQVATIQLDFNMPNRFGLVCTNEKNEKEPVVMIHCAIMGSIERFTATLIEHLAGVFPFWLAPVQVWVLPITDAHQKYGEEIRDILKDAGIRVELHDEAETLGKKIRNGKIAKIPFMLVVGDKEVESRTVTIESRDKGNMGAVPVEEIAARLENF